MTREKLLLKSLKRLAATKLRHKLFHAGGMSRSRQDGIHGHTRPSTGLSQAARNCQLSCLRHAVMNHFLGSVNSALAADENDPPPLPLHHAGKIGPTEANAAEDIDLEVSPPFSVGNFLERFGLINSQVVNEDIHCRKTFEQLFGRLRRGKISSKPLDFGSWHSLLNLFEADVTALLDRPFTMTCAPSAASWRATAKPMPLVDPEITAVFLFSSRFIEITPQ